MMVGADAVTGTIGGGQLEYLAIDRARQMLARGEGSAVMDIPLGPEIGQCCGGRVELTLDFEPQSRLLLAPLVRVVAVPKLIVVTAALPLPVVVKLLAVNP